MIDHVLGTDLAGRVKAEASFFRIWQALGEDAAFVENECEPGFRPPLKESLSSPHNEVRIGRKNSVGFYTQLTRLHSDEGDWRRHTWPRIAAEALGFEVKCFRATCGPRLNFFSQTEIMGGIPQASRVVDTIEERIVALRPPRPIPVFYELHGAAHPFDN